MDEDNLKALVEQRNEVDYEAYQLLVEILDEGLLDKDGSLAKEARSLQERRRKLDQSIVRAGVRS